MYKYFFTSTKVQIQTPEQLRPSKPSQTCQACLYYLLLLTTIFTTVFTLLAQRPSKASKPEQSFEGECLDLKDFVAQALEATKFTLTNGILSFKFRADSREQMEQVPDPSGYFAYFASTLHTLPVLLY
jgi:hypothetical protein